MRLDAARVRFFGMAVGIALAWLVLAPPPGAMAQMAPMTEEQLKEIPAGPQPIKFSHKVHTTDNSIACQYCHIYARRSQVSGAPPVAICMGCHKLINTGLSEIKKVTEYWEKKEPIPWVKIHDVPDFVRFLHRKHINAKNEVYPEGLQCQDCHGPIQDMHVVQKFYPNFGQMGWCLSCHLTIPGALERKRAMPEGEGSTALLNALRPDGSWRPNLTDCLTCHK